MAETSLCASFVLASVWMAGACSTGSAPAGSDDSGVSSGSGGSSSGSASSSGGTGGSGSSSGSSSGGGSSGSSSGSVLPTTGVCANTGTRVLTTSQADAFIDDFEESTGISPGWSSFNDVSDDAAGQNVFKIAQAEGGAAGTAHAGHYAGTGAKTPTQKGFGVGTLYNVAIDPGAGLYCVGISAFTGVSFWAKAATAGATVSLNYVLPQLNMSIVNDAGVPQAGDCQTGCYNYPHVEFTLTTSWALYTAPFAMATGGTASVGSVIQEVEWLSPDSDWDFTIDEIAFYAGTPPAGAVGPNPAGGGSSSGGSEDSGTSDAAGD
jgi:hypothetical protein